MPTNGEFGFSVLVGGKVLSEYAHPEDDSRILVESILYSPVSYCVELKEFCVCSGEIECQPSPVTPYVIKVYTEPWGCSGQSHYKVYIDGMKVAEMFLESGESKIIHGFTNEDGSYSEFLFSLPRLPRSKADHVGKDRSYRVGKIEVIRHEALFSHNEMQPIGLQRSPRNLPYKQANKDDVWEVTKRMYLMATTRKGRKLRIAKPYDPPKDSRKKNELSIPPKLVSTPVYDVGDELDRLHVEYQMNHTLLDWGIQPIRPGWPTEFGPYTVGDGEEEQTSSDE